MPKHKYDYFGNGEWFMREIYGTNLSILLTDNDCERDSAFVEGNGFSYEAERHGAVRSEGGFVTLFDAVIAAERAAAQLCLDFNL